MQQVYKRWVLKHRTNVADAFVLAKIGQAYLGELGTNSVSGKLPRHCERRNHCAKKKRFWCRRRGGGVGAGLGGPIEVVQYSATRRRDDMRFLLLKGFPVTYSVSSQSGNTYRVNIADPENALVLVRSYLS